MANNVKIGSRINLVAPIYDWVVKLFFGHSLDEIQNTIITGLPSKGNCLIIGGGSGRILEMAIRNQLADRFFYAELSSKMIEKTKLRCRGFSDQVLFSNSWKDWQTVHFDYVILPFVLDFYKEESIRQFLNELSQSLANKGKIIFVDFRGINDEFSPSRYQRNFIKLLYWFFRNFAEIEAHELAPFKKIFTELGYKNEREETRLNKWIQAIVWAKTSNTE